MWLSERRRLRAMPFSRQIARAEDGDWEPLAEPKLKLKSSRMPLSCCLGEAGPLGGGGRTVVVEEEVGEGILSFLGLDKGKRVKKLA